MKCFILKHCSSVLFELLLLEIQKMIYRHYFVRQVVRMTGLEHLFFSCEQLFPESSSHFFFQMEDFSFRNEFMNMRDYPPDSRTCECSLQFLQGFFFAEYAVL